MPWTKDDAAGASVNTYRHALDGIERVFYDMAQAFSPLGKEHTAIYNVCTIRFDSSSPFQDPFKAATALRNAWMSLRLEYPNLGVVIKDRSTKVYVLADSSEIQAWADETFFVDTMRSVRDVLTDLDFRKLPCLFYLPRTSQVLFHTSHWRLDGVGELILLDRLFNLLANAPPDSATTIVPSSTEIERLSPPLEVAMPALRETKKSFDMGTFKVPPSTSLPCDGDASTLPSRAQQETLVLTEESTKLLVAACKTRSITVTAAVHAALAETIFSATQDNHYDLTAIVAVNMRKYIPPPYNTKAHACAAYFSAMFTQVRRDTNFTERTLALTNQYKTWSPNLGIYDLLAIAAEKGIPLPPPKEVHITSIGIVEQYLKGDYGDTVYVDRFHRGTRIQTRQLACYPWTFRKQMHLSINYNDAYYSHNAMRGLLLRIKATLELELDLVLELFTQYS